MTAMMSASILIGTVMASFGVALGLGWIFLRSLLRVMPARGARKAPAEFRRAA